MRERLQRLRAAWGRRKGCPTRHAEDDCGAAPAGRVVKQERHRIERSEVNQSGEVLAARLVGGEKQTRQASGRAKTSLDASQKGLWRFVIDSQERPDILLGELEAQ